MFGQKYKGKLVPMPKALRSRDVAEGCFISFHCNPSDEECKNCIFKNDSGRVVGIFGGASETLKMWLRGNSASRKHYRELGVTAKEIN